MNIVNIFFEAFGFLSVSYTVGSKIKYLFTVWKAKFFPLAERILKYTAPKGDAFNEQMHNMLEDISYDGMEMSGIMLGGLGQLVDGIRGEPPEDVASENWTNWIGWVNRETLQITFEFAQMREFPSCSIHMAHVPHLGVEVKPKF